MKINIKKTIIRALITLAVLGLLILIGYFIFKSLGLTNISKEQLQEKLSSYGALAPLAFIVLSFLQVTFIPIPSIVTILVGNYLFGFWLSLLYSFIGIILGSLNAFFLGRVFGKKVVYWIVGDKDLVEYYLSKLKNRETILLFFMFLLPMFPDDALCGIAGITKIETLVFVIIQIITRFVSITATLLFMSGKFIPYNAIGIPLIIIGFLLGIVAFIICYKNSEKINYKLDAFCDRLIRKQAK